MASSSAKTVAAYLAELAPERRKVIARVRAVIRKHLPKGYVEGMGFGMIVYEVPLTRFPDTYNGQPLTYVALAAQKNAYSLYLMGCYGSPQQTAYLHEAYQRAGKKLDMGKSCVRFKSLDDLPLDAIARIVAWTNVEDLIAVHEDAHAPRRKKK